MSTIQRISELSLTEHFNLEDWVVPALPKEADKRGFIYIVRDLKYPELIKFGKTIDFVKRVKQYNNDRPYEDVYPVMCTRLLRNCDLVEKHIKNELLKNFNSVGKSEEWFEEAALMEIYKILESTEFNIDYTLFNDREENITITWNF